MRNIHKILLFSLLSIYIGCDIVEEPYMNDTVQPPDTGETVQKVLLEEFTGHQCPNCPAGAQIASQLGTLYGNRFIVIAYHAGFFARTNNDFPTDYRTPTGDELNTHFGVVSYPAGLVNRKGTQVLGSTEWATVADEILNQEPKLDIDIERTYNPANRQVEVTITATALADLGSMNICVFLTESGLISPQKTSNDPNYPSGIIPTYEHKHVFRAAMNGTWGTEILINGAVEGEQESLNLSLSLNSDWIPENMKVVCFAYLNSNGEIVQAEQVGVR